jgi:hypothetical protein
MLSQQTLIHETATTPQLRSIEGVPTRTDVAFSDKSGKEKKAVRQVAEKALKMLGPALRRLLARDEFVVYVANACAPMGPLEQYTFGYFAQFVSRVTLVFTNQRVLAFRVNSDGKWRDSVRGCALGDMRSAKTSGWIVGYLKMQYASGKKESYWAMKSRDRAKLQVVLPKLMADGNPGRGQGMQPLCPSCGAALVERQYACSGCGQKFRSEESLWWRTFIPGAAYFYARQTGMGVLHAITDGFLMLYLLMMAFGSFATTATDKKQDAWIAVAFIAFLMLVERCIALFHARRFVREFLPEEGTAHGAMAAAAR